MKTILQVFVLSLAIITMSNCTASKKASKQTEEQQIAQKMCDCLAPIIPMMKKLEEGSPDEQAMIMEEFQAKSKELEVCVKEIDKILEDKKAVLGTEFKAFEDRIEGEVEKNCPETYNLVNKTAPK